MNAEIYLLLFMYFFSCKSSPSLDYFNVKVLDSTDLELENELNESYKLKIVSKNNVAMVEVLHNNPCYYCCETIEGGIYSDNGKIKLFAKYEEPTKKIGKDTIVPLGTCTFLYTFQIKHPNKKLNKSDFIFEFRHYRTKSQ